MTSPCAFGRHGWVKRLQSSPMFRVGGAEGSDRSLRTRALDRPAGCKTQGSRPRLSACRGRPCRRQGRRCPSLREAHGRSTRPRRGRSRRPSNSCGWRRRPPARTTSEIPPPSRGPGCRSQAATDRAVRPPRHSLPSPPPLPCRRCPPGRPSPLRPRSPRRSTRRCHWRPRLEKSPTRLRCLPCRRRKEFTIPGTAQAWSTPFATTSTRPP